MTALRVSKPHPAASHEAHTKGWAKRAPNFPEVLALAETWRWRDRQTVARARGIVADCTPSLSCTQRSVLQFYAERLNDAGLRQSDAFVFVSVGFTAHTLNVCERSVRQANAALEAQGFVVRHYNGGNRPDGNQRLDLAPLFARLDELEAAADARKRAYREERDAWKQNVLEEYATQAEEGCRLEQSPINEVESVRGSVAPSARDLVSSRQASPAERDALANGDNLETFPAREAVQGSPRGSVRSGGVSSAPAVGAKALQEQLAAAVEACPELQEYVAPRVVENPSSATPADFRRVCDAAQALLPEPERNNGQTAYWGLQRHGLLVVAMLALALKGRKVQSPCGYFAGLALSDASRSLDFRLQLANLLPGQGKLPAAERTAAAPKPATRPPITADAAATIIKAPGSDDPVWLAVLAELSKLVVRGSSFTRGTFDSYADKLGFHGIEEDMVRLSAPPTAAAKWRGDLNDYLRRAVARIGLDGFRVEIRDRYVTQPNPYGEEL